MKTVPYPLRQIHLDFHTSPDIPDVAADWDPKEFARTLVKARVNSINIFAKCHHGMNYYPTRIGPVHPALKVDLLGEMIEACHRHDIKCPIYFSLCWDMSAAERHPEWRQIDVNGRLVGRGPFESGWGWPYLCVNNGYADEVSAQVDELLSLYDCDGFWFDILMYDGAACLCPNCFRDMKKAGRDPQNAAHRQAHTNEVARRFMARLTSRIRTAKPDADIFYNSRMGFSLEDEFEPYGQVEIESLPTGGWGYGFYPFWSRFGRNFNRPMVGMTGRFHRGWADWGGLKHPAALQFECGGILATGGAVCIGDQMHPRGRLNPTVYRIIGDAFQKVEKVETYCHGAVAVPQAAILVIRDTTDRAVVGGNEGPAEGAAKMLLELHHQFDVITTKCPDFNRYELLVVPDRGACSPALERRLRDFVRRGGRLLISNEALLDSRRRRFPLADLMGVDYLGPAESNPDYFQVEDPALVTPVTQPGFPYCVYDGPSIRVTPHRGTQVLAEAYGTYFNRTWEHFSSHQLTPPLAHKAGYPAITRRGRVVYLHSPIFGAYLKYGNLTFRELVGQCLKRLLPSPRIETNAPSSAEISLMRQGRRHVVHIVNYHPCRRATPHVEILEQPVPLCDVSLRVRGLPRVRKAFLAGSGKVLRVRREKGAVSVTIPRIDVHEMVVLE